MIDLNKLPREIRDLIELKEATDMTFSRFCLDKDTLLFVNDELKKIKYVKKGDILVGDDGNDRKVIDVWKTRKNCLRLEFDSTNDLVLSEDHKVLTASNKVKKLKKAKDLVVNDVVVGFDKNKECSFVIKKIMEVGKKDCVDVEIDKNKLFALGNGIVVHNCDEDYTDVLWNLLAERANPNVEHSFITSIYGTQGVGKSMCGISMCCFLDPNFSIDNVYFDYNDLVYNRHKLKSNTAVLVDEQSQSFGLDSHRVMIILASLKEQLRKKSIHFIFCSPTLYEEHKSSMYLMETLFIDYENQESYSALKTKEGLTLGHVRIPYPLKVLEDGSTLASKKLIDDYETAKDAHLERVLGKRDTDIFEERAVRVMKNPLFMKAEKIYVKKMGYIPNSTCIQIINKIYPEFNAGVVPLEIAGRIKLDKELSGNWDISGRTTKKDRKTPRRKKR